jgi:hypothetical protein
VNKIYQSFEIGFRRRWARGLTAALSVLGTVWLLTEVVTRVSKDTSTWLDSNGAFYLTIAGIVSVAGFLVAVYERREVSFTIPTTGTTLSLKFGNIFDEATDWIVAVNEYFDSTLGDIVASTSLHGQVISRVYGGNEQSFRADVDKALDGYQGVTEARAKGHPIRYPLGTVAVIKNGPHKIYLMALTRTDAVTHRANSTVPILWDALGAALAAVDRAGNGAPLAMPLIGNGRASLNIAPQHLLRLIALKIVDASRSHDLPRKMTVNLSDDCFEHLDIVEIKRGWSVV